MRFKFLIITLTAIILLQLSGCSADNSSIAPSINNGMLDLTNWDFASGNNLKLDGEWDFYWNRLLSYKDIAKEVPDIYAEVPSTWNNYRINGTKLPRKGYATYRLHVKTALQEGTLLGLRPYAFSSAYNIFIDDKMIASNGKAAESAMEEVGEYRPQVVIFSIPDDEFDIIIQVSNFHYAKGGFWYSMYLGSPENIINYNDITMGKEIFLIGALLIIALFYFAVYILRKELRYTLYFALLCFTTAIGVDMVGQFILVRVFGGINLNTTIFIWYSSSVWIIVFLTHYVYELFPSRFSNMVRRLYLCYAAICQAAYILTEPVFYTGFAYISNYFETAVILCTVIAVALGIKNKNKSGWLNIISMIIVLITYIHDILYWTNNINSDIGEIFYLGLLMFMFIQMVIQAQRIKLFHENEIAAELSFLQAQIKPHFLYNTLNTFVSISYYDMDRARRRLIDLSHYLRRSFDFKELSQFVPLKDEIALAEAYAEIEKARFEERLEVTFDVPEDLEVKVPTLMLQPLIENAVIHGILPKSEGGRIDISIKQQANLLVFMVKDNGIGMSIKKLSEILKQETGKSVGIANIEKRLTKLYGKGLDVKSNPGAGTEIAWTIPFNSRRVEFYDKNSID